MEDPALVRGPQECWGLSHLRIPIPDASSSDPDSTAISRTKSNNTRSQNKAWSLSLEFSDSPLKSAHRGASPTPHPEPTSRASESKPHSLRPAQHRRAQRL